MTLQVWSMTQVSGLLQETLFNCRDGAPGETGNDQDGVADEPHRDHDATLAKTL